MRISRLITATTSSTLPRKIFGDEGKCPRAPLSLFPRSLTSSVATLCCCSQLGSGRWLSLAGSTCYRARQRSFRRKRLFHAGQEKTSPRQVSISQQAPRYHLGLWRKQLLTADRGRIEFESEEAQRHFFCGASDGFRAEQASRTRSIGSHSRLPYFFIVIVFVKRYSTVVHRVP